MSLRDALQAAVARCAPQAMQHATTTPNDATGRATVVQQRPRGLRDALLSSATADATDAQQASCTAALEHAVTRYCRLRGYSAAERFALLTDAQAQSPRDQADLLGHFLEQCAIWQVATGTSK